MKKDIKKSTWGYLKDFEQRSKREKNGGDQVWWTNVIGIVIEYWILLKGSIN